MRALTTPRRLQLGLLVLAIGLLGFIRLENGRDLSAQLEQLVELTQTGPASFIGGHEATYTYTITNNTGWRLESTLENAIPTSSYNGATHPYELLGVEWERGPLQCSRFNDNASFRCAFSVEAAQGTVMTLKVKYRSAIPQPCGPNETITHNGTVTFRAWLLTWTKSATVESRVLCAANDLSVTHTGTNTRVPVLQSDGWEFSTTIKNMGPLVADNVTYIHYYADPATDQWYYAMDANPYGCRQQDTRLICAIGKIMPSIGGNADPKRFKVRILYKPGAPCSPRRATTVASTSNTANDPDIRNNFDKGEVDIGCGAPPPPPPPPPGTVNGATFISAQVPTSVRRGGMLNATITMKNTGTTPWKNDTQASRNPHRLGAQNPQDNRTWGTERIVIPDSVGTVPPGGTVTFTMQVTAPSAPGEHRFAWRMVQDGVEWFGETLDRAVRVTNEPAANDATCEIVGEFGTNRTNRHPAHEMALMRGMKIPFILKITNTGTATWDPALGYKIGTIKPYNNNAWGIQRLGFSNPVPPGGIVYMYGAGTVPNEPGKQFFSAQTLREHVEWFGIPCERSVTVGPQIAARPGERAMDVQVDTYQREQPLEYRQPLPGQNTSYPSWPYTGPLSYLHHITNFSRERRTVTAFIQYNDEIADTSRTFGNAECAPTYPDDNWGTACTKTLQPGETWNLTSQIAFDTPSCRDERTARGFIIVRASNPDVRPPYNIYPAPGFLMSDISSTTIRCPPPQTTPPPPPPPSTTSILFITQIQDAATERTALLNEEVALINTTVKPSGATTAFKSMTFKVGEGSLDMAADYSLWAKDYATGAMRALMTGIRPASDGRLVFRNDGITSTGEWKEPAASAQWNFYPGNPARSLQVRAKIRGNATGIRLAFDTDGGPYVTAYQEGFGPVQTVATNGVCPRSVGGVCDISVTTAAGTTWRIASAGSLFLTAAPEQPRSRQFVFGRRGDDALRIVARASDTEDIQLKMLQLRLSVSSFGANVDRLAVFTKRPDGMEQELGSAAGGDGCGPNGGGENFCVRFPADPAQRLIIPKGSAVTLLVKPVMKGTPLAGVNAFRVSMLKDAHVAAAGLGTQQELTSTIFIGTDSASGTESDIHGPEHNIGVKTPIISISAIPTNNSFQDVDPGPVATFRFVAGLTDLTSAVPGAVKLTKLRFTVKTPANRGMLNSAFKIYDKANPATEFLCTAKLLPQTRQYDYWTWGEEFDVECPVSLSIPSLRLMDVVLKTTVGRWRDFTYSLRNVSVAGATQLGAGENDSSFQWADVRSIPGYAPSEQTYLWADVSKRTIISKADSYSSIEYTCSDPWALIRYQRPSSLTSENAAIVFNGKMWAFDRAPSNGNSVAVSSSIDGSTWEEKYSFAGFTKVHSTAVYQNKLWVAVGGDGVPGKLYSSSDGLTWTAGSTALPLAAPSLVAFPNIAPGIIYPQKLWLIGDQTPAAIGGDAEARRVYSSPDGNAWTLESSLPAVRQGQTAFVFDNKFWVVGGRDGTTLSRAVYVSSDGRRWEEGPSLPAGIAYGAVVMTTETVPGGPWTREITYETITLFGNGKAFSSSTKDGTRWVEQPSAVPPAGYVASDGRYTSAVWFDKNIYLISGVNGNRREGSTTHVFICPGSGLFQGAGSVIRGLTGAGVIGAEPGPEADLSVTLTSDHEQVAPNDLVSYTAVVQNNGPDTATNTLLTIVHSPLVEPLRNDPGRDRRCTLTSTAIPHTYLCNLGTIHVGLGSLVTVRGRAVSSPCRQGQRVDAYATVQAAERDSKQQNNFAQQTSAQDCPEGSTGGHGGNIGDIVIPPTPPPPSPGPGGGPNGGGGSNVGGGAVPPPGGNPNGGGGFIVPPPGAPGGGRMAPPGIGTPGGGGLIVTPPGGATDGEGGAPSGGDRTVIPPRGNNGENEEPSDDSTPPEQAPSVTPGMPAATGSKDTPSASPQPFSLAQQAIINRFTPAQRAAFDRLTKAQKDAIVRYLQSRLLK